MQTVTISLPEEVFSSLRQAPDEFVREMRLAAAIHWYTRGQISQGKAAEIAGIPRVQFLDTLAREKIDVFPVNLDTLAQEIERD